MARVLIVDDSPTIIRFAERALEADGHSVTSLDSFVQLAALVRENPPDVILLDLQMPALSGRAMGALVREYQTAPLALLIYSSLPEGEMRSAASPPRSSRSSRLSSSACGSGVSAKSSGDASKVTRLSDNARIVSRADTVSSLSGSRAKGSLSCHT